MIRKVLLTSLCFVLLGCQQSYLKHPTLKAVDSIKAQTEFDSQLAFSYDQYETIRKHIQIFSLTDEDVKLLRKLFPKASNLHQLAQKACDTSQSEFYKNNHRAIINAYSKTYREFMLQPSNSDVLYNFLRIRTKWIYSTLDHVPCPGSNLAWGWAYFAKACLVAY